jgi:hypothetical protein
VQLEAPGKKVDLDGLLRAVLLLTRLNFPRVLLEELLDSPDPLRRLLSLSQPLHSRLLDFDESQGALRKTEEFGDLIVVVLVSLDGEFGLFYSLAGMAQSVIDAIGEDLLLYSQQFAEAE